MISVDSCVFIDYLQNIRNAYTDCLDRELADNNVCISPVVVTELLSHAIVHPNLDTILEKVSVLEIEENYWKRAGHLRAHIRRLGFRANLGDALIAQSCIDHDVPLLTTDVDFRHYAKAGGLKLAIKFK